MRIQQFQVSLVDQTRKQLPRGLRKFDARSFLLDVDDLAARVDAKTKVVAVAAASNFLGTRSPLPQIARIAHEVGALLVVDAVHHVCHGPTDVRAIGADALVFSGYKLFSRHGSFLYLRPDLVENLSPYKVDPSPKHGPEKWEWGTRDQAMFAAISGTIDYLASAVGGAGSALEPGRQRKARLRKAMVAIEAYEERLSRMLLEGDGISPGLLLLVHSSLSSLGWVCGGPVAVIQALGVEIRCGVTVGVDVTFEELRRDHAAVIIAVGAKRSRALGLPGESGPGVLGGVDLLRAASLGETRAAISR